MKNIRETLLWSAFIGLALVQSLWAQEDSRRRFFVHLDLGPAMVEDTKAEQFLGPVQGAKMEFDPGVRFDVAGGYQVTDWFAVEMQSGFTANYIDRIKGVSAVSLHDSSYSNIPLLVNAVFQYPTAIGLIPYVGAGAGGSVAVFYADDITDHQTFIVDGSDSDVVFAYQGFAGVRYRLNEKMQVGLVYKYFVSEGPSWNVEDYLDPTLGDIELDTVEIHSLNFTFSLSF